MWDFASEQRHRNAHLDFVFFDATGGAGWSWTLRIVQPQAL